MNVLAVLIISVVTATPKGIQVTTMREVPMIFEPLSGVHVFQEEWTIVMDFKPVDVSDLLRMATELVEDEERVCKASASKSGRRCTVPFLESKAIIYQLRRGQEAIESFSGKRVKRALDFVLSAFIQCAE